MKPVPITPKDFPSMPYSHAVVFGDFVFVSGQTGMDYGSGNISDNFETQARQAFENIAAALHSAGSSLELVAKTTIWLPDAANFEILNKLYQEYFPKNAPARSTPIVDLPKPIFKISIEAIAAIKK